MKIWVDDVRQAPDGYVWCKNVHETKIHIMQHLAPNKKIVGIQEINLDHDAGEYASLDGDYIELLKWLEEKEYGGAGWNPCDIHFHIHSMNPVGVQNMRAIIQRNGWKEV